MTQMENSCYLWKTIILTSDRVTDTTANTNAWISFLGLNSVTDFDKYYYVVVFSNNKAVNYPANMIWYNYPGYDNGDSVSVRQSWTNVGTGNKSVYASTGTRIDIYKIPKHE